MTPTSCFVLAHTICYQLIWCCKNTRLTEGKCPFTARLRANVWIQSREEKAVFKEPGYSVMLSEWWTVSLCQHNKSRDTWHSELHPDELIAAPTKQLSSYRSPRPVSLMTHRLGSDSRVGQVACVGMFMSSLYLLLGGMLIFIAFIELLVPELGCVMSHCWRLCR